MGSIWLDKFNACAGDVIIVVATGIGLYTGHLKTSCRKIDGLWLIIGDLVIIIPNERLQESKQQILVPALYLDIDIDNPMLFHCIYIIIRVSAGRRPTTDDLVSRSVRDLQRVANNQRVVAS